MDTLFENKYTKNKEWAKDVYGYICFRRPLMIVAQVLLVLNMFIAIIEMVAFQTVSPLLIGVALSPFLFMGWTTFIYFFSVRMVLKRDLETHGKEVDVTVTVTEEQVNTVTSSGTELRLLYGDVKKAVQTKKCVYLWSRTNMLYSFKKDSFSVGNTDGFLQFLKSKGIRIK